MSGTAASASCIAFFGHLMHVDSDAEKKILRESYQIVQGVPHKITKMMLKTACNTLELSSRILPATSKLPGALYIAAAQTEVCIIASTHLHQHICQIFDLCHGSRSRQAPAAVDRCIKGHTILHRTMHLRDSWTGCALAKLDRIAADSGAE